MGAPRAAGEFDGSPAFSPPRVADESAPTKSGADSCRSPSSWATPRGRQLDGSPALPAPLAGEPAPYRNALSQKG